jgi:hypothetical protein
MSQQQKNSDTEAQFTKLKYLTDYIKVYDDVLPKETCEQLIKAFSESEDGHEKFEYDGRPNFTQLNITDYADKNPESVWHPLHDLLVQASHKMGVAYMTELGMGHFWPDQNALEQYRMKWYKNDGVDRFDTHVDVGNHESAKRFLVMFFYLNDVEEGGETDFPTLDFTVKPKAGRLVIFPPLWTYPHTGKPPISDDKFIIGTYLHYV